MAAIMPMVNKADILSTKIVSWCFLQKLRLGTLDGLEFILTTVKCIELAIDTLSGSGCLHVFGSAAMIALSLLDFSK